jgi:hypothetical protein
MYVYACMVYPAQAQHATARWAQQRRSTLTVAQMAGAILQWLAPLEQA